MYPGSIPSYAGFTGSHTLSADNHAAQHNAEQADLSALATKLGTGASTPASGLVLRSSGAGISAWGQVNQTTDVTGVLPIVNGGTGGASAPVAAANLAVEIGKLLFPIGCVYTETTGSNPSVSLGFGTWTAFGAGRVLVGNGTSDAAYAAGATGGESTHVLTATEMPSHTHTTVTGGSGGATYATPGAGNPFTNSTVTGSAGSDGAHNNLQPYIVVYFWKRTA